MPCAVLVVASILEQPLRPVEPALSEPAIVQRLRGHMRDTPGVRENRDGGRQSRRGDLPLEWTQRRPRIVEVRHRPRFADQLRTTECRAMGKILTTKQVAFYEVNRYVHLRGVVPPAALQARADRARALGGRHHPRMVRPGTDPAHRRRPAVRPTAERDVERGWTSALRAQPPAGTWCPRRCWRS